VTGNCERTPDLFLLFVVLEHPLMAMTTRQLFSDTGNAVLLFCRHLFRVHCLLCLLLFYTWCCSVMTLLMIVLLIVVCLRRTMLTFGTFLRWCLDDIVNPACWYQPWSLRLAGSCVSAAASFMSSPSFSAGWPSNIQLIISSLCFFFMSFYNMAAFFSASLYPPFVDAIIGLFPDTFRPSHLTFSA